MKLKRRDKGLAPKHVKLWPSLPSGDDELYPKTFAQFSHVRRFLEQRLPNELVRIILDLAGYTYFRECSAREEFVVTWRQTDNVNGPLHCSQTIGSSLGLSKDELKSRYTSSSTSLKVKMIRFIIEHRDSMGYFFRTDPDLPKGIYHLSVTRTTKAADEARSGDIEVVPSAGRFIRLANRVRDRLQKKQIVAEPKPLTPWHDKDRIMHRELTTAWTLSTSYYKRVINWYANPQESMRDQPWHSEERLWPEHLRKEWTDINDQRHYIDEDPPEPLWDSLKGPLGRVAQPDLNFGHTLTKEELEVVKLSKIEEAKWLEELKLGDVIHLEFEQGEYISTTTVAMEIYLGF